MPPPWSPSSSQATPPRRRRSLTTAWSRWPRSTRARPAAFVSGPWDLPTAILSTGCGSTRPERRRHRTATDGCTSRSSRSRCSTRRRWSCSSPHRRRRAGRGRRHRGQPALGPASRRAVWPRSSRSIASGIPGRPARSDLVHRPVGVLIPHGHVGHAARQFVHVLDPGLAPTWRHAGEATRASPCRAVPSSDRRARRRARALPVVGAPAVDDCVDGLCLPQKHDPFGGPDPTCRRAGGCRHPSASASAVFGDAVDWRTELFASGHVRPWSVGPSGS